MAVPGTRASAELKDKDGKTIGTATLREQSGGVLLLVRVEPKGLTPGLDAVHIHAVGKCDAPGFTSAAGHFNPSGEKHGFKNAEGAHAGDMPNKLVTKDGSGRLEVLTDGSALVIHVRVDDDVTDPTGNAGDRAACGLIVASN